MAKMTLLEMVQDVLNDMDSDSVNSIDDTEESIQVAQIVKTAYFKLAAQRDDWPFLNQRTTFTGLGDVNRPTWMEMPEGMNSAHWVKYNKKHVEYLSPELFQEILDTRTPSTGVVDSNGYGLDHDPQYWTSFDDQYAVFDSIDLANEATLVEAKCVVFANMAPAWTHDDAFVPKLPDKMFPTLLSDAKGTAFLALKQQANAKEEDYAKKGKARWNTEAHKARAAEKKSDDQVNYGRC